MWHRIYICYTCRTYSFMIWKNIYIYIIILYNLHAYIYIYIYISKWVRTTLPKLEARSSRGRTWSTATAKLCCFDEDDSLGHTTPVTMESAAIIGASVWGFSMSSIGGLSSSEANQLAIRLLSSSKWSELLQVKSPGGELILPSKESFPKKVIGFGLMPSGAKVGGSGLLKVIGKIESIVWSEERKKEYQNCLCFASLAFRTLLGVKLSGYV